MCSFIVYHYRLRSECSVPSGMFTFSLRKNKNNNYKYNRQFKIILVKNKVFPSPLNESTAPFIGHTKNYNT